MKTTLRAMLVMALAVLYTTGCQQTSQQRPKSATHAPAQAAPAPAPAAQPCTTPTAGLVKLSKQMPREAALGQNFEYQLVAVAQQCVGNVVIIDQIPAGASYVRSEPAAAVAGDLLTWKINQMDAAQTDTIRVWLKADKEGTLTSCATVSADPRVCATTLVGKPSLAITKTGPSTANLGSTVTYTIVVTNNGSAMARGVVVTDNIPAGLQSADGKKQLTFDVGDLAPRQFKSITVPLTAAARGEHCNAATAKAANAGEVSAEACTTVMQPGLAVFKTGDKERFLGRRATYSIMVTNTGDTTLTDVVVTDTAPAATGIVTASGATVTGNQAVWRIPSLGAKQARTFEVVLTSTTAGNHCNAVAVTAAGGLADKAEACTLWRGVAAVLLEVVDDPDPIQVDEQTTYTIRVTNQGTADMMNIGMAALFDTEMAPVTSSQGTVSGKAVKFPAVNRLAPKQVVTYTISAKGVSAGDARNTVTLTADGLATPVVEEESTHVY